MASSDQIQAGMHIAVAGPPIKDQKRRRWIMMIGGILLVLVLFGAGAYFAYEKYRHFGTMLLSAQQIQADSAAQPLWQAFNPQGWATQLALPLWWLAVEALGVMAFPLAYVALPGLHDRGWGLAKTLGILLLGYFTWLLVSVNLAPYGRAIVWGVVFFLVIANASIFWWLRHEMLAFVRRRWRSIVIVEILTLAAFLFFILIRVADPDLWHISRTSETMQDFGFLNAILRSKTLPPIDPWFAGGYMNYYYFGTFMVATLIQLTGVAPTVAYNLAIPTLYALLISGTYTVVAGITRRPWLGLLGVWCVGLASNLSVIPYLLGYIQAKLAHSRVPMSPVNFYWQSGHVIPGAITEFPYWSFLNGDLHPYVIDMPFEVLGLGIAASLLFMPASARRSAYVPVFIVAALVIGGMVAANTWDAPTYIVIILGCYLVAEWRQIRTVAIETGQAWRRQMTWQRVFWLALPFVAVPLGAIVLYLPYNLYYVSLYTSIGPNTLAPPTTMAPFLQTFGLWLFILTSYFTLALHDRWQEFAARRLTSSTLLRSPTQRTWAFAALAAVMLIALFVAGVHALLFSLLAAGIVLLLGHRNSRTQQFIYLLTLYSLAVITAAEFVHLRDIFDNTTMQRMNTIFKFYEQIWILLAVSSTLALWQLWQRFPEADAFARRIGVLPRAAAVSDNSDESTVKRPRVESPATGSGRPGKLFASVWMATLATLLLTTVFFLLSETSVRLDQRFVWPGVQTYGPKPASPSLDGFAFMYHWYPGDAQAIAWLDEHVSGAPVILEASTDQDYKWYGRVAVFTGLPDVVGWEFYEEIFRGPGQAQPQYADVATMFTGNDAQVTALLQRYHVRYVYVGQLECLTYGIHAPDPMYPTDQQKQECDAQHGIAGPLTVFDQLAGEGEMHIAYQNAQTTIFAVD